MYVCIFKISLSISHLLCFYEEYNPKSRWETTDTGASLKLCPFFQPHVWVFVCVCVCVYVYVGR